MIGNSSLLAAVLTVVSVMWLSLLSVLCLRCKKKSKVIHEEHQIYNPQMLSRQPTRGKCVCCDAIKNRQSQEPIRSRQPQLKHKGGLRTFQQLHWRNSQTMKISQMVNSQAQNTINTFLFKCIFHTCHYCVAAATTGSLEHTYVAPLPISIYENEQRPRITDADQTPDVYANMHTSSSSKDDEDDYENSEFLDQVVQEQNDDEPDYVNENG
ncbi:uncharacterized protein LOC117743248 isoform X4 [Cyclopterus lumpus]|uniref:uncharacterized protein LOC117743248 isoform X4 n=1 Tax=Cyclopterus lumpus TaxID=8103 RepID=UPI001486BA36|nr:uncharacterized protein LOC117743248 isoform X4 [Cyclopterus lumpus]